MDIDSAIHAFVQAQVSLSIECPLLLTANVKSWPLLNGRNRPILLKKSAMVCASKKYVSEIEVLLWA